MDLARRDFIGMAVGLGCVALTGATCRLRVVQSRNTVESDT